MFAVDICVSRLARLPLKLSAQGRTHVAAVVNFLRRPGVMVTAHDWCGRGSPRSGPTPINGVPSLGMYRALWRHRSGSTSRNSTFGAPSRYPRPVQGSGRDGVGNSNLMVYLAVFGGIALFALVLTVVALRIRRSGDAESRALRAAEVIDQCQGLLVGPEFLWAVWQDTDRAAAMTILIRDERDAVVSTVTVATVPLEGVLRRFELDGGQYEIYKPGLMSKRICLRESGRVAVLLSADHDMLQTRYFRGDGEKAMIVIPVASVLSRFLPCRVGQQEVGKLIIGLKQNSIARVLTLPKGQWSRLEQVFLLANV